MTELVGRDRLILALDVPSKDEVLQLVDDLDEIVSFFKVGLLLLLSGDTAEVVQRLIREKHVFIDLKLPDDLSETIRSVASFSADLGVEFLTLSASAQPTTVAAALQGRGKRENPKLLSIPMVSGRDRHNHGVSQAHFEELILDRAREALGAGCDGLIASGDAIRLLRNEFPRPTIIVSPGIRPVGFSPDDHRRFATPSEAIALGADYLVVGRPIRNAPDRASRRRVAQAIIDEIDGALESPVRRVSERNPEAAGFSWRGYGLPGAKVHAKHS